MYDYCCIICIRVYNQAMRTLEQIQQQPGFPVADLHEDNANFICLSFGNRELVEMEHNRSKLEFPFFQTTHPALMCAAQNYYAEPDHIEQINYGISMFEALHGYVSSGVCEKKMRIASNLATLKSWVEDAEYDGVVRDYLEIATKDFHASLPNTAGAIQEASARYYRGAEKHVLVGASWARTILCATIDVSGARRIIE